MKSSNINIKKYSPFNLEQFKNWLRDMKERNETKFFEVYVDDFKVVPRTDTIDDFDNHQQYVDDETTKIRVLVYNTQGSNRPTQSIFILKEPQPVQQHSQQLGAVEMEAKIEDGINKGLKGLEDRLACEQVKKELAETKEKLSQSEQYSEKLAAHIESLKEKLDNAKNLKEVFLAIKEYGPVLFGGKPHNPSLSGSSQTGKPQEEASFKMKSSQEENPATDDDKHFIEIGKMIEGSFSEQELLKVYAIIDAFASDKSNIHSVESFLNLNTNQQKTPHQ